VITRGMLELGKKSDELHYKIAEEISLVADELVVITPDFAQVLKDGMLDKFRTKFILIDNPEKLLEYVKKSKNTNDVILVENRIPKIIAKELGL
jgi:UDP-N-acetylmuramyl pentapeptide synthase